jgi:hypothetical protein
MIVYGAPYRGALPGFDALMVRVPDARRTIILLSNARTTVSRFDARRRQATHSHTRKLR